LGGKTFLPENYLLKINKMPTFYVIFARKVTKMPEFLLYLREKINKIPEFRMIGLFARKMPEFHMKIVRKIFFSFFWGGARAPPPPRLLRLWFVAIVQKSVGVVAYSLR